MKSKVLLMTLMLATIAGCATDKHIYTADGKCLSCWNNPITGKPINHDNSGDVAQIQANNVLVARIQPGEGRAEYTASLNVETAANRIRQEFNFHSAQDVADHNKSYSTKWKYTPFEHSTDAVGNQRFLGERAHKGYMLNLDIVLISTPGRSTMVTITYSPNAIPGYDKSKLRNSFNTRLAMSLPLDRY